MKHSRLERSIRYARMKRSAMLLLREPKARFIAEGCFMGCKATRFMHQRCASFPGGASRERKKHPSQGARGLLLPSLSPGISFSRAKTSETNRIRRARPMGLANKQKTSYTKRDAIRDFVAITYNAQAH